MASTTLDTQPGRRVDRDDTLDCAMKVFWEKGFDGTSSSDLIAAMGISSPSLYAVRSLFGFVHGADSLTETYWKKCTGSYHAADPRTGQSP
ncbi:Transcriptional regulator [Mycobacterium sp. PO1]|nr:Transcriptional regulator [Mycobacterium sp. PO1]GFM25786.1 transcriptional regulator [Mycobacterium sp. PO2]